MENKLTFADFDNMIEILITELQNSQNIFVNQFAKSQNIVFAVQQNNEKFKIKFIAKKLQLLNDLSSQINMYLLHTTYQIELVEELLKQLENTAGLIYENCPTDLARIRVYGTALNIYKHLNYYIKEVDMMNVSNKLCNNQHVKDPVQQVVAIMIQLLESMDYIEMKIHHIKDCLLSNEQQWNKMKSTQNSLSNCNF